MYILILHFQIFHLHPRCIQAHSSLFLVGIIIIDCTIYRDIEARIKWSSIIIMSGYSYTGSFFWPNEWNWISCGTYHGSSSYALAQIFIAFSVKFGKTSTCPVYKYNMIAWWPCDWRDQCRFWYKVRLPRYGLTIRQPYDCLIFIIWIPVLVSRHL